MKLEAEGAFFNGGVGSVSDAADSVEPGFVGVPFNFDFEGVPVLGFDGGDGFLALGRVALFRNIGSGGHIALEGAGHSDLDLIVLALEHDAGVDSPFSVFVFESEGEIGEVLLGPEDGSLTVGAVFGVDSTFFHRPMRDTRFGFDEPTFEVCSIEESFGVEEGGERDEKE